MILQLSHRAPRQFVGHYPEGRLIANLRLLAQYYG
jgi:hypothetical protein